MASSISAALDYLSSSLAALPELAPPVVVSDGWPVERSNTVVIVGIDSEDGDSEITAAYAELSRDEYESVSVPCLIAVRRSGDGAAAQARSAAVALLDEVRSLIAADRRLGGAVRPGLPARVASWTMSQTAEPRQAGEGRVCEIRLVIEWQHRG